MIERDEYGFNKEWIDPQAQAAVYRRMLRKNRLKSKDDEYVLSHTVAEPKFCARLIKEICSHIAPSSRILSIAEGEGHLMQKLAQQGYRHVQAVDICSELVMIAREKGLNVILGNANALPFEADQFDAVIINEAIGAIGLSRPLKESSRVLKPGGQIIITNYNYADHQSRVVNSRTVKYRYILAEDVKKALAACQFFKVSVKSLPIYSDSQRKKGCFDKMDVITARKPSCLKS